jgi:hypothetical protein
MHAFDELSVELEPESFQDEIGDSAQRMTHRMKSIPPIPLPPEYAEQQSTVGFLRQT